MRPVFNAATGYTVATFYRKRPTLVGKVGPYRFYIDPDQGRDAPLLAVDIGGHDVNVYVSHFYELPDLKELFDDQ